MSVYVSNCGHDERGRYTGGVAGDQTGTEWHVIPWYQFGQNVVLRHPSRQVGELLSELAREAASNNHIGYDQDQRGTFWAALRAAGYRPRNITNNCETDCSAGVCALTLAAGYLLGDQRIIDSIWSTGYTGNMRHMFREAGFKLYTRKQFTGSSSNLLAGDINLNESVHTNIVVSDKAAPDTSSLEVDGWIGYLSICELQRQLGTYVDGVISGQYVGNREYIYRITSIDYTATGSPMVYALQRKTGAGVDGIIGPETVRHLQTWLNIRGEGWLDIDGYLGPDTAKALQRALNRKEFV